MRLASTAGSGSLIPFYLLCLTPTSHNIDLIWFDSDFVLQNPDQSGSLMFLTAIRIGVSPFRNPLGR
jgi:hypothetical protein